jgi:glycine betaine/proline transport system permease protein
MGYVAIGFREFPESWYLNIRPPINAVVNWARVSLYEIEGTPFGTRPFSDFLILTFLNPIREFLTTTLPWQAMIALVFAVSWAVSGWRLAVGTALATLAIGFLGMWDLAMDTLSQVVVAVFLAIFAGIPLGIWSAKSDTGERIMRPINDFLQTIPSFCYLVPVIMLFSIGRVPGIIAAVAYALPPVVRLTSLGIRGVDSAAIEAAESFGSTGWQVLQKVEMPLAMPAIMLGINQTIMMVLAMVIIAGLVGSAGLGLEVVTGLARNEIGRGLEAGLAIVLMAIVIDRISQAWAERQARQINVG